MWIVTYISAMNRIALLTAPPKQFSTIAILCFFSSDFIDHYLLEMRDAKDPTSTFYKEQGSKTWIKLLCKHPTYDVLCLVLDYLHLIYYS